MSEKGTEKRNGVLDLLKVAATLCIVLHHYQQFTGAKWQGLNFWEDDHFYFGFLVELFFVISGIVSYADIEKIKSGKTLHSYWGKKFIRIMPPVALSVICYEALMIFYQLSTNTAFPDNEINLGRTLVAALGIQTWVFPNSGKNNPIWFISSLLLCYLILYGLVKLSEKHKGWKTEHYCIVMILIGCATVTNNFSLPLFNRYTGRSFYAFFFGILLWKAMNGWRSRARYLISGCIFIGLTLVLIFLPDITKAGVAEWYGINLVLLYLYYPAMILFLDNPFLKRVLSGGGMTFIARISFGAFVWHQVIHTAFIIAMVVANRYYDLAAPVIVILILITDYIAGILSYCLIEKNVIKAVNKRLK